MKAGIIQVEAVEDCGRKAAKARRDRDAALCQSFYDYAARYFRLYSESEAELREAFDRGYWKECGR